MSSGLLEELLEFPLASSLDVDPLSLFFLSPSAPLSLPLGLDLDLDFFLLPPLSLDFILLSPSSIPALIASSTSCSLLLQSLESDPLPLLSEAALSESLLRLLPLRLGAGDLEW